MSDQPKRTSPEEEQTARLTAFVLGELSKEEQQEIESQLSDRLREDCDELKRVAVAVLGSDRLASLPDPSAELRDAVESKLAYGPVNVHQKGPSPANHSRRRSWLIIATSLAVLLAIGSVPYYWMYNLSRVSETELAGMKVAKDALPAEATRADDGLADEQAARRFAVTPLETGARELSKEKASVIGELDAHLVPAGDAATESMSVRATVGKSPQLAPTSGTPPTATPLYVMPPDAGIEVVNAPHALGGQGVASPNQLAAGPTARGSGIAVAGRGQTVKGRGGSDMREGAWMYSGGERSVTDFRTYARDGYGRESKTRESKQVSEESVPLRKWGASWFGSGGSPANEQYAPIVENRFVSVLDEPLSTFSIDVDTASYANARRFLSQNQMPPADAIRIEEFINYFSYDYPAPKEGKPFSVNMEIAECPWQSEHRLVRIGLKGKEVHAAERPDSNIVFLLDVSGSMQNANKLPLLKQAMKLLTDQLTERDRVSIVTYAGNAGLALETTNGESKQTIRDAIDALNANGSTNGSAGIQLAYDKATESFIKEGANRVILATDGDLNVGVTDDDALITLIKEKAASGVFLTVLGFGEGNLKDGKLEKLADNGNGMYAYIDSLREARKVLVEQITGSLVTIAKDVKIKVEFNPAEIAAYRLLGYENRLMSVPDFDNDAKDAGEIGAGHTVTALYEIVPTNLPKKLAAVSPALKYQRTVAITTPPKELTPAAETGELLTLFLRYKQPDADESTLTEFTVENIRRAFDDASTDFRFAAAVASFGMVLRDSEFRGNSSLAAVEEIASSAIGSDAQGHRTELLDLVRKASSLQPRR